MPGIKVAGEVRRATMWAGASRVAISPCAVSRSRFAGTTRDLVIG